jgi:hypothetical protein
MKVRSLVIFCSDFFSVSESGVEIFYISGDAGREELSAMVFSWRNAGSLVGEGKQLLSSSIYQHGLENGI